MTGDPVRIDLLESHSVKDKVAQYQREIDDAKKDYSSQIELAQQKLEEAVLKMREHYYKTYTD